jgi:hypothetical protein
MNYKDILIGVLVILAFLLFFKDPSIEYQEKIVVKTEKAVVVDTVYKEVKINTPIKDITIDTFYVKDLDTINVYKSRIGLQYGNAIITTHSTGIIKYQEIDLNLLLPEINTLKTINKESILPYRQHSLYLGVGGKVGINAFEPSLAIGASIHYRSHLIQYHYDTRGTSWITYHRQIYLKKPTWKKPFNF